MDFDDADLDGDEMYLVYGGDLYDDQLDISPPPTPPPPKRKPVKVDFESEWNSQGWDTVDEDDYKKMHDQIRQIQSNFLDESDALQRASKKSDKDALRYVTGLMEKVSVAPVSTCNVNPPRKSGSHQVVEVSMPGTHQNFLHEEETPEPHGWRHRGRLSTDTVARLNKLNRSSGQKSHTPSQLSEETQIMLKTSPKPGKVPGQISTETVHKLQANNPRSPFARTQSLKAVRSEGRPDPKAEIPRSERRKQIEQKLEGILDYEIPTTDRFCQMRRTLLDVNDKMAEHRILLDKYSGIDMSQPKDVDEEVEHRYNQLIERMPARESRFRSSDDKLRSSSMGVTGYGKGLVPNDTQPVTELRGRIRRLLCRSKNNPHYYRF